MSAPIRNSCDTASQRLKTDNKFKAFAPPTNIKMLCLFHKQGAAEITPTFQRGITNKWYEVSPKTFYFQNVDIKKFFYFRF
jgi:hypothetical protein